MRGGQSQRSYGDRIHTPAIPERLKKGELLRQDTQPDPRKQLKYRRAL